ncbi:MAG: hypothetical protein INF43_01705 [Alphaproteobacteria bacterium]|jgi:hypothetical protein|nr:hypothetical protein [Alphaproteobacteria bacterium]
MPGILISLELNAQFERGEQYPLLAVETLQARQKLLADSEKLEMQQVTPEVFWSFFSQARQLTPEWSSEVWASMLGVTSITIERWLSKEYAPPQREILLMIIRYIVPS